MEGGLRVVFAGDAAYLVVLGADGRRSGQGLRERHGDVRALLGDGGIRHSELKLLGSRPRYTNVQPPFKPHAPCAKQKRPNLHAETGPAEG